MSEAEKTTEARLLRDARTGDQDAIGELLQHYRQRIAKMVAVRMDPKIRSRVDQSDVVQDAYLEVAKRLPEYLEAPRAPFLRWVRKIANHKLIDVHRQHLGAQMRTAEQELSLDRIVRPAASSICLANQLMGRMGTPSQAVVQMENIAALQGALDEMKEEDREILVLRQFEELSNQETADELGIEPAAASKRFTRALQRLKIILEGLGLSEFEQ